MSKIKLAKLPDKTPVKLAIMVAPDLHQALQDYAAAYAASYGSDVPVTDLVPAILSAFLDGDRGFQQQRKGK
ncbi:DUF2274 domain-containing protein [Novosphingobium lindaniclasticum]|uniref:Protein involved in integration/excision of ICE Tn4371 family n=1 Tax=Novosphingobium lindaniclasticum LE124 TaxID=1096930 RepID=T0GWW2_9SPHN|nr:DUF2274 domain-containing protein [Novosphingobium lindaniclasticum]EQB08446.1 hypothetical protein L284_21385 [Novosphingobium lindaniclasticum LE124]